MTSVAVLVPVLERPQRVGPLIDSLTAAEREVKTHAVFLVSPHDLHEQRACKAAEVEWFEVPFEIGPGDYARKINFGADYTLDEYVFMGADDLKFHPGWADVAVAAQLATDVCVVGTNDLGNGRVIAGHHATHSLVHRDYIACGTVDEPGKLLHEGYHHNFVDDELVETAKARGTYHHCADSKVEHLHPNWGKGQDDNVYRLGERFFSKDRTTFSRRRRLWQR
jgi:hypothetical protein